MECPVCYECATLCTFTCGHAFCDACTKKWYTKGAHPTCPMCRSSICFRGILKKKRVWYQDRLEGVYTNLMTQVCDELFEDYGRYDCPSSAYKATWNPTFAKYLCVSSSYIEPCDRFEGFNCPDHCKVKYDMDDSFCMSP